MGHEVFTVWVTKYALTKGIYTEEVRGSGNDPQCVHTTGKWTQHFILGRDVFKDEDQAKAAARVMLNRKVASLRKQIAKLVKMEF